MDTENRKDWKQFGLVVVGEDVLEGQKMYVLEGKVEPDAQSGRLERTKKVWVGQEDLFVHRAVTTRPGDDPEKRRVETMELTEVKVDQKVDAELFKYTPPAGAEVEDRTARK